MKFAVKTVTCLGCKTPLRANNSVKSRSPSSFICAHAYAWPQMVPYVGIVVPEWESCIKNKLRAHRSCKSDFRDFGHSVSAVKGLFIRYVISGEHKNVN
jgi:hypothetical protein